MTTYYNFETGQTAIVNGDKADKDGNVWVEIDGGLPQKVNWERFVKEFILANIKDEPTK